MVDYLNLAIKYIKNNLFESILLFCILFLLIYGLYNKFKNKKGTWSEFYHRDTENEISTSTPSQQYDLGLKKKRRRPPTVSKGEAECKRVLESIFERPFNKIRPYFLNNKVTGGDFNLEIDCYNQELNLGVEYNGKMHYEYITFFHKNYEAFLNQKYRDELKKRMCKDEGLILIEVPYTVKQENIESFLIKELKKHGYLR